MELTVARRTPGTAGTPAATPAGTRPARPAATSGDVISSTPSPRAADAAQGTLICPVCELYGGPFEPEEAAHLIGLHNDLHHGGVSAPVPSR
jgi:hypothetical protein